MCLADFIDPRRRLDRRLRGRRSTASSRISRASRRRSTIIRTSCSRRWPTGSPRPLPSGCTSMSAPTLWGYAPGEQLTNEALIKEQYRGIRPAPGYPACPDHSLKPILFELLDAQHATGISADRKLRDAADGGGVGLLFRPPAGRIFRRRADRPRSARGLCRAARRRAATGANAGCGPIWIEAGTITVPGRHGRQRRQSCRGARRGINPQSGFTRRYPRAHAGW